MISLLAMTPALQSGASVPRVHSLSNLKDINTFVRVNPTPQEILAADIIFIHRCFSSAALAVAKIAKQFGKPLWLDFDDAMLDVPIDHTAYPFFQTAVVQEALIESLKLADIVTISNPAIAPTIAAYTDKIICFPCAYHEDGMANMLPMTYAKRISWRGSTGSQTLALRTYAPVLQAVANANPEWEWLFIGDNPWMVYEGFTQSKVRLVMDATTPDLLVGVLCEYAPSIHLSLHVDNTFSRCRSAMGYLDASIAGAICVARDWPQWRLPGIVHYETPLQLEDTLNALIQDVQTREPYLAESVIDAQSCVRERFGFSAINSVQRQIIGELL